MPIPGRRTHLCSRTELTLGSCEAAKIGSTASCSAAALAPQWRPQPPGGSNWGSGRPGGARGGRTTSRLQGPGLAAVEHTRRGHLNSGAP